MKFINHNIKSAMQSILTSNLYKIHYKWMLFYYPFDTRNNLLHHLYIHLLTSVYTVNIYNDSYPITKTFSWEAFCQILALKGHIPMGSLKLSVTNLLVHGWDIFPHGKLSVTYLHKQTYSHGKLSVNIPRTIFRKTSTVQTFPN